MFTGCTLFDVLSDPVRCRILELLADGELTAGAVCGVIEKLSSGLPSRWSLRTCGCCARPWFRKRATRRLKTSVRRQRRAAAGDRGVDLSLSWLLESAP